MSYTVSLYKPEYRQAFIEINREWIETNFVIEAPDVEALENLEAKILEPGGEIFFVVEDGVAFGAVAMIPHGERCYELAKMGVSPSARGRGYGDVLMSAAIEWARARGADRVMLESNTKLTPAIALYRKHGFKEINGVASPYARCNIAMELVLNH